MSSTEHHQDTTRYNFQSPTTANELHGQPHTASPMTTSTTISTTPESRLAAAIGHAIATIPSTSFEEAIAIANITSTKPLIRTISDANSSVVNQDSLKTTSTVTPPTNTHCPIGRAPSDMITNDRHQQPDKLVRRALSDTAEYQQSKKMTPSARKSSSSPLSSNGNKSPYLVVVKKIEEMVRECMVMLSEHQHVENLDHDNTKPSPSQPQATKEEEKNQKEECVGVERGKNGDINFELSCSCGKHFEMLIKQNGYCIYKLT